MELTEIQKKLLAISRPRSKEAIKRAEERKEKRKRERKLIMKSYTDLEQSKKLAEILPIESADMRFCFSHTLDGRITGHYPMIGREPSMGTTPCWSLAALLNILPSGKALIHDKGNRGYKYICNNIDTYFYDNPVDAAFEMIIKLHEQKIL